MRFVNNFELSSILGQPEFCSSNRLGVMAIWRDEVHFEIARIGISHFSQNYGDPFVPSQLVLITI